MVLEIGFRFLPPDEEIIRYFLLNKMMGNHDRTRHIREIDLLQQEPWELPALSTVKSRYPEWLFFYRLNKISEGKCERKTQAGYWKSTGQDRDVKEGGSLIGSKKTLVFHEGRTPRGVKTDWVIHEYRAIPALSPSDAEVNNYVVGLLRKTAVEGHTGNRCAASSSQSNAVGAAPLEAAPRLQSNSMDYDLALQTQMEDQGFFDYELFSPSFNLPEFDHPPSSSGVINNGLITIEEEGISLEDLQWSNGSVDEEEGISLEDLQSSDGFVDYEDELQLQFNDSIMEEEMDFIRSSFPHQDDHFYEETGLSFLPDYRAPASADDNPLNERIVHMSGGTSHGHSGGLNHNRMENSFHHDDILIMNSSVDSATITTLQSNCIESLREEKSVNSRTCKSQYEPKFHKAVLQRHPKRVQLQVKSSGKSESRDKTRGSGAGGAIVKLARNNKSIGQSKKDPKMDRDRNTISDSSLRSDGSAGSSRKNTFNFVETSQLSCKEKSALVYFGNVVLGLILVIVVLKKIIFLH